MTQELLLYHTAEVKILVYGTILLILLLAAVVEGPLYVLGMTTLFFLFTGPMLGNMLIELYTSPLSDLVGTILVLLWQIVVVMICFVVFIYPVLRCLVRDIRKYYK